MALFLPVSLSPCLSVSLSRSLSSSLNLQALHHDPPGGSGGGGGDGLSVDAAEAAALTAQLMQNPQALMEALAAVHPGGGGPGAGAVVAVRNSNTTTRAGLQMKCTTLIYGNDAYRILVVNMLFCFELEEVRWWQCVCRAEGRGSPGSHSARSEKIRAVCSRKWSF